MKKVIIMTILALIGLMMIPAFATAATFTGGTIHLSGVGATINITGCVWNFTQLVFDDGGGWLYVENLSVDNPVVPPFTYNYTTLSGDKGIYTCNSFPYHIPATDEGPTETRDSFLLAMLTLTSMFALVIVAVFGYFILQAFRGTMDTSDLWDIGIKLAIVVITLTIITLILAGVRVAIL